LTLCTIFDLGNIHVVVGNKQGALVLLELASDGCVWKIKAQVAVSVTARIAMMIIILRDFY